MLSVILYLTLQVMFRDCDKEAFGAAAAQNRRGDTRACRISAPTKETVYRLLYVFSCHAYFFSLHLKVVEMRVH